MNLKKFWSGSRKTRKLKPATGAWPEWFADLGFRLAQDPNTKPVRVLEPESIAEVDMYHLLPEQNGFDTGGYTVPNPVCIRGGIRAETRRDTRQTGSHRGLTGRRSR